MTEAEISKVFQLLVGDANSITLQKDLMTWLGNFDYSGFNPVETLKKFFASGDASKSYQQKLADLVRLISLSMTRTANFGKERAPKQVACDATMAQSLVDLCAQYDITNAKKSEAGLEKDALTIPRLVACSAPIMHQLLTQFSQLVDKSPMCRIKVDGENLPPNLRFPGSNCLYRDDAKAQEAYKKWSIKWGCMIASESSKKSPNFQNDVAEKVNKFAPITAASQIPEFFKATQISVTLVT